VVRTLPYDRQNTTMSGWLLDDYCAAEYRDPANRRFHAQPVACPACGPNYYLQPDRSTLQGTEASIRDAAQLLNDGTILAIKGLGGYHLACDASNSAAVAALRDRKYRKEKPFALMAKDVSTARSLVDLSPQAEDLLTSTARPIVLAPAKIRLAEVSPDNHELGVMLPYTPLHHLLFAAGAPGVLVMTSANRSSEPIAFEDKDALERLAGIADSFLIGQRPIARRVDDSVARVGAFGPAVLRRARGYAPGAVTTLPTNRPILAVGADLKNTVSQHIGDLDHYQSLRAFHETISDLLSMYEVHSDDLLVVRDLHPQYASTAHAESLPSGETQAVQHHRAHIASALAERSEWTKRVAGVSFDGTGYGDDGTVWGGEFFVGSLKEGFERVAHLRPAVLAGGDAAAEFPVQAAAGFLTQLAQAPDFTAPPFSFPPRYRKALELVRKEVRAFPTTSVGRLFDATAALLGFTRDITFEGQAAIWLEQLGRVESNVEPYPFPFSGAELDFRSLLSSVVEDRLRGRKNSEIARAFQLGIARGVQQALTEICSNNNLDTIVLSGGVFQNELLLGDLKHLFEGGALTIWVNRAVPPNDGGISLGQAALAAFGRFDAGKQPVGFATEQAYA
jgi:hydrogenase maturation protein HypF